LNRILDLNISSYNAFYQHYNEFHKIVYVHFIGIGYIEIKKDKTLTYMSNTLPLD